MTEAERTSEALAAALIERDVELAAAREEIAELRRSVQERDQDLARLQLKLDQLARKLFGRSSEKLAAGQLDLLDGAEAPAEVPDDEATHETPPHKRRKGAHGRKPLPRDLPRERVVHELPESERCCAGCGETMQPFGEDVTEELDVIPARLFVREHVRPKYACRTCQDGVKQAPLPPRPIEKGRPGPGLLAQVLVSKYVDHLPLARQSRIFARHGLEISRSTLCDWVAVCAEEVTPIVALLRSHVLASGYVQADETPIVVLEDHNEKRRRQGWLWVYRGRDGATLFDYRPTRARDGPQQMLADYRGYLQRDGYQGYGGLPEAIVEVGCWAHARRYFFEARSSAPTEAQQALDLIGRLYAVERTAHELEPQARAALRREHAAPVLAALRARLEAWQRDALPRSELGKAVTYALGQWPTLVRYLDDGALAIDNNAVENAIRPVALGRKNWLFAGSAEGARRAAILYTMIASAQAAGIEPFEYFADILTRTATTPPRDLLPAAWKAAHSAAASA